MSDNDMIRRGDALADRAVRTAEALRNIGPMLDLRLSGATIIYELLAQHAALRAEVRKSAMDAVSAGCQAQEAWENVGILQARVESLTAEVARLTRVVQMQPTRPQDTLLPQIDLTGCKVCGVRGVMGYVCPRPDCPTAVRATS